MQMEQQRATLEKRKAPNKRQKRECCGSTESPIVVARRSWSEISGGKLGTLIQQTKNSLNFVSTCLKVVDTRRMRTSRIQARYQNRKKRLILAQLVIRHGRTVNGINGAGGTVERLTLRAVASFYTNQSSLLRFGGRRLLLWRPRAAGWRNDAVHPQVFDHLTIMIHRMPGANTGNREAR